VNGIQEEERSDKMAIIKDMMIIIIVITAFLKAGA
jgi:hypothetical protein